MRNWKRLFYYLFINVLVSACVTVMVLTIWERTHPPEIANLASSSGNEEIVDPETGQNVSLGVPANTIEATPVSAVAEPTEASPAEPSLKKIEYAIQSGDTLGKIADRFDVTIEEIIAANDLDDPNRLDVGQIVIIPGQPGTEPEEPEPQPEESAQPPAATGEAPQVSGDAQVSIDSVIGAGDLNSERVLLKRTGSGELSLAGWQLLEEDGAVFTFPKLTLFEDGAVYVHSASGQATVVDLFWGLDAPVWEPGETVVLLDNTGDVKATYRAP
ncbi:MAG TPA: LysM peptidoglycan-binding domain-containing protein [Anaerolineales bacterium]|jgi:LysM repeat protein